MSEPEVLRSPPPAGNEKVHCSRRALLVFKIGRQYLHAVTMDPNVRLVQLPLDERRYLQPLLYKGKPYPVRRAVRRFLEAGRALGITDGARDALKELREQIKEVDHK